MLVSEMNLFTVLLSRFDNLSLADRDKVIAMIDLAVDDGRFSSSYLAQYVGLLTVGSASTAMLVARHLERLITSMKVTRSTFRELGFVAVIVEFLEGRLKRWSRIDRNEINVAQILLPEGFPFI